MKITTLKKTALFLCFVAFCWNAYVDLLQESKYTLDFFKRFYGLSDSHKRAALFGDTWSKIDKISRIIPLDSKILFQTHDSSEMLYCAYYLFPRKIYFHNFEPNTLPREDNLKLDWEWLERKQVTWIVVRTSDRLMRVMKIADGKILQEIHFPG